MQCCLCVSCDQSIHKLGWSCYGPDRKQLGPTSRYTPKQVVSSPSLLLPPSPPRTLMSLHASASSSTLCPVPRRPGILVRTPSSDCVIKRCVKWSQSEAQIFEVEEWDRSPCPVTPKLTYRSALLCFDHSLSLEWP